MNILKPIPNIVLLYIIIYAIHIIILFEYVYSKDADFLGKDIIINIITY